MKNIKSRLLAFAAILALTGSVAIAAPSSKDTTTNYKVGEKVRKELVTLPYYGVFDNLAYKVEGSTVTLYGQVVRPTTRSSAERRVKNLEGIEQVVNNIEVLPLSSFDDDIRLRTYRTVFNTASLYRYALGANPSLHIIVNRGRVTLEGMVGNKGDAQLAYIAARGVPGVFEVTNNLRVEGETADERAS
ncbi:MAG: BON domain-containing protein [Pyrinomonadaceae bacterium MAG19_C2-C3]|nr:BON domain-containing protein [Pyrinomonadaceae bacterium MAG19_C2-C3]